MVWQIRVSAIAEKQLAKLDRPVARRIIKFLRERVAPLDDPRSIGEALRGSNLGEFWKYRVGDWRLVCEIEYLRRTNFSCNKFAGDQWRVTASPNPPYIMIPKTARIP